MNSQCLTFSGSAGPTVCQSYNTVPRVGNGPDRTWNRLMKWSETANNKAQNYKKRWRSIEWKIPKDD